MKAHYLKTPPPGYTRVSWAQIRTADETLWKLVAAACESGTKAAVGKDKTAFEEAWCEKMFDHDVRADLAFLPASSSAASPAASTPVGPSSATVPAMSTATALQKMPNKLENCEKALANAKRKLNEAGWQPKGKGTGKAKRNRRTFDPNRAAVARAPAEFGDLATVTPGGDSICFGFNLARGCPLAKPGERCHRGVHLCPRCLLPHSLTRCTTPH